MSATPSTMRFFIRPTLLAAAAIVAAAAAAPAADPVPAAAPSVETLTGFEGAAFGASVEAARAVLPAMEELTQEVKLPAAAFSSPYLKRFILKKRAMPGLASPADVELRFWQDKLWAFLVYFDKTDTTAALRQLTATYGERSSGTETRPIWRGSRVTLQAMGEAGWYGATDNAISDEARAWFFKELTGNPQGNQPAPTAATPAAASKDAPAAATPATTPQAAAP